MALDTKHFRILVIDVGGSHVKMRATTHKGMLRIKSDPKMTAKQMVRAVQEVTASWNYDAVSIGYPGQVVRGKIVHEPHNLGKGWRIFNFEKGFACPVKIINDAAMQALGSYHGGRMLFLGFGTGLGSALIIDDVIEPMELAHLPYKHGQTYEDYVGLRGLKRLGKERWLNEVKKIVEKFKTAFQVDYVVLGGGDARLLKKVSSGISLGSNSDAFLGGCRLWNKKYKI